MAVRSPMRSPRRDPYRKAATLFFAGGALVALAAAGLAVMQHREELKPFLPDVAEALIDEQPSAAPPATVVTNEPAPIRRESKPARTKTKSANLSQPVKTSTRTAAVTRASAAMSVPADAVTAAAPAGRLFEPSEVDTRPAVVTRVEPRVPREIGNDVVVLRLLVSQTGHPYRVGLLRKSRAGSSVDDAVVGAVSRWTFSPARKKGEAVSCWYNVAVPLGQAD